MNVAHQEVDIGRGRSPGGPLSWPCLAGVRGIDVVGEIIRGCKIGQESPAN